MHYLQTNDFFQCPPDMTRYPSLIFSPGNWTCASAASVFVLWHLEVNGPPPPTLFFINEDRTKYVSVGFYPAREYVLLVEFGVVRRGGRPKTIVLSDEHVDAMAVGLRKLRDAMCNWELADGSGFKSGAFRIKVRRIRRKTRLYVD